LKDQTPAGDTVKSLLFVEPAVKIDERDPNVLVCGFGHLDGKSHTVARVVNPFWSELAAARELG
jgi:hypothetical protein